MWENVPNSVVNQLGATQQRYAYSSLTVNAAFASSVIFKELHILWWSGLHHHR